MKKLFATFVMLIVALSGWATITETSDGNTVTLNYVDDGNQNDQNYSLQNRSATTVVLTGDWANKDLGKLDKVLDQCQNNIYLDMSACEGFVSKVKYTGTGDIDWTSDNFVYLPNANYPETVQRSGTATESAKYYNTWALDGNGQPQSWATPYTGDVIENNGIYYENNNGQQGNELVKFAVYLDENGKEVPASSITENPDGTFSYSFTETLDTTPFKFKDGNFNSASKLNGIAFPNSENFTAIPEDLFDEKTNLRTVVLGSSVVWIGNNAFRRTGLTSCNFPASLKVIGSESFDKSGLTVVDLSACTSLVAIKYEAFEGTSTITSVKFPAGSNFTFLGNDVFKELTGLTSVDMSMCTGLTEFQSKLNDGSTFKTFYNCTGLKTVILPPNLTAVPDDNGMGVFQGCKAIESVKFTGTGVYNDCELQNPCTIGDNAFAQYTNLHEIILSTNISYVGYQAFHSATITEIHIPASVEELAKHSFYGCVNLTKVYFDEFDKTLGDCDGASTKVAGAKGSGGQGQGAFEECQNVTDVYVNTMAELDCLNNGFDQDITWGAGDAGAAFATLHFPKEKAEHYVNLHHYLTDEIIADPALFHNWLMEHYDQAVNPHKNGWYEFINAGPSTPIDGPEYEDIILRTFSDWDFAYLVPNGIRAYVVNGFEKLNAETYQVSLKRIRVIPKQTGVILYGHPNGKTADGKHALVMTPVRFLQHGDPVYKIVDGEEVLDYIYEGESQGLPLCRANWGHSSNYVKNYLEPIITEDGSAVHLKPYEKYQDDPTKPVMYRNFALGRYSVTDYAKTAPLNANENNYVGFFRMKDRNYASGYAYLRFAGDVDEDGVALADEALEFALATGGEILVKEDAGDPANVENPDNPAYYCEFNVVDGKVFNARTNPSLNPKGWWDEDQGFTWKEYKKSWGDRTIQFGSASAAKYFGELEEDADGIIKVVIPANQIQGDYYTLQGVRVTNPTKGVYIQNGKKVILK